MMELRENQLVAYLPKDSFGKVYKVEIGRIKRIDEEKGHAFVWYHSGGTAACTKLADLHRIENDMFFENNTLNYLD